MLFGMLFASSAGMLLHNVRYTLRLLRKSPGFTAVAVLTLALGIGANTAVFSVVDAVMLKPLPYGDPGRLVAVWEGRTNRPVSVDITHGPESAVSPANLVDYVRESRSFERLAGYASISLSLTRSGPPEQLLGEAVTWNYFATLGASPSIGRAFRADEDRPGSAHVVVLSDSLWRGHFGADAAIVGRSISLNSEPYTVVGVMPPTFEPLTQFGSITPVVFFVPAAYPDALLANHGDHEISVVGRLKPGVSVAQAQADLDSIASGLAARFPATSANLRTRTGPLAGDIARHVRTSLLILLGAVALVLLVACVNVANLLIVRAVGQRRDVAIRLAIGATRRQIAANLLTRGLVLGALGGAAGLLCGVWTRDTLVALAPTSIPRLHDLALNAEVLAVTGVLSALTGIVAGVLPAWQASRVDLAPALRATELTASGGHSVIRWRGALMAAEVAAALVLAVAAGLLVRSLVTLSRVDLGFQTERVLAVNITLPETRYGDARKRLAFFDDLATRVQVMPGVQSVAFANRFPMRGGWGNGVFIDRGSQPAGDAGYQAVSVGYFSTLGVQLLRGRVFTPDDRLGARPVAIVSQTFVRRYIGDRDPLGFQFSRNPNGPYMTVIGVVGEVRRDGKAAALQPEAYLPAAQTDLYPVRLSDFAVRATVEPRALVSAIRNAVRAVDADQPITNVKTLDEVLSASMAERRFELILLLSFALLAVGLALVGVYGVVAYAASERTREIGIRMALGAAHTDVVALVVRSGLRWSMAGIFVGLVASAATTRVMSGLLFGVTATDPLTFAGIAVIMIAVAVGASYVPARRAASLDPVSALRTE